jgi:hypothetical protein
MEWASQRNQGRLPPRVHDVHTMGNRCVMISPCSPPQLLDRNTTKTASALVRILIPSVDSHIQVKMQEVFCGQLTYSATASAKIALPCCVCKYRSVKRKT